MLSAWQGRVRVPCSLQLAAFTLSASRFLSQPHRAGHPTLLLQRSFFTVAPGHGLKCVHGPRGYLPVVDPGCRPAQPQNSSFPDRRPSAASFAARIPEHPQYLTSNTYLASKITRSNLQRSTVCLDPSGPSSHPQGFKFCSFFFLSVLEPLLLYSLFFSSPCMRF